MPVKDYGVLTATAVAAKRESGTGKVHFQIHLKDQDGKSFRAPVNVLSDSQGAVEERQLKYVVIDDFRHPVTAAIAALGDGWHPLEHQPGGAALDYIRGNLFDAGALRILPADVAGPDNDLEDLIEHYAARAVADPQVRVSVVGSLWLDTVADKIFPEIDPSTGVHDVHMNQGNAAGHQGDDGVWNDGGLLFHLPAPEDRWVAIFLAFQNQDWHTDDRTGHSGVAGDHPTVDSNEDAPVRIVAAMVNPVGGGEEAESVLLLNASPDAVDLSGWTIADKAKAKSAISAGPLAAGQTLSVPLIKPTALGNQGGIITLLDANGLKVSGVSYTKTQGRREGWTVAF
jgi:uncharacterized protein YukJ